MPGFIYAASLLSASRRDYGSGHFVCTGRSRASANLHPFSECRLRQRLLRVLCECYTPLSSLSRNEAQMSTTNARPRESEVTILARVFCDQRGQLSPDVARHILELGSGDRDKARMHDLAVRNQDDDLSPAEKDEMLAFAKAGDLLAILKSKACRTLRIKPNRRTLS